MVLCFSVLSALCGVAAPVGASVDDYVGKPIESVHLAVEGRETTDASIMRVVETRVGQPLSMAAVRESITHLYSLRRFEDVRVDASVVGGRVALRYELSPVHPVTRIEFTGMTDLPGIDTGQLRNAVVARYGTSPPLGRVAELTQVVIDALGDRGYLRPDVKPRADLAHAPDRATLVFALNPGPQAVIGSIDVVGPPDVSRPALLNHLGLSEGAVYRRDALNARIDRYVADRRKAGYYEAKLVAAPTPVDGDRRVNLVLTVVPGPRVRIVFVGDPIPSDKRAELVPVEREGSVDEDLLEDSTNRIEDYLHALGYRDGRAPHSRDESGDELRITFDVKRGPEYRVVRIDISGNASVPSMDFESTLRLRAGQPFTEAALDADVARIEDVYHRLGFAGVKAQPAVEVQKGDPSVTYVSLLVRVVITEGPRTLVGSVRIEGNASVSEATLKEGLGLQPGRPYDRTKLVLDRDAIQLQYVNLGYPNATVDASPNFSADRALVDPLFVVREGPRVFVEHVLIVGNVRTSSNTITRELQIKPGDPLSASARLESQRRLATLGLFRRIQISELSHGDESTRDLVVTVEEAPATTLAYGGGFEVRLRVVRSEANPNVASEQLEFAPRGSFQIGRRNFFGKNRSVNLFTSLSLHPKDSPFFAGQTNTSADSGGFGFAEYQVLGQFREPRVFGTLADALITATLEQQIRSSFNFARRSASAEIGRIVTSQLKVSGRYQIQRTRLFDESINPADKRLIDRIFPQVRLSSFSASAIADTRDDLVDPGSGRYVSVSSQIAARKIGSEVGFVQTFVNTSGFRTLPGTGRIVLAGNARLGLAAGFQREVVTTDAAGNVTRTTVDDLPASERFFAGGDTTVRGFALDTLGTPQTLDRDGFPIGGNGLVIFNAEMRARVRGPLTAVGFWDVGNVFARAADINLTDLRSAVGFGVRYKSPVGPIRVDVGFKVHREEINGHREGLAALHISLGQAF